MADKTIPDLTELTSIDRAADLFEVSDTSDLGNSKKTTVNSMLNITSQPMGLTDTQSPTNKTLDNTNTITLKDTLFTLQDDGDITKQAKFQLSGITTGTTRTYTLPNASSTLVDLTSSQTLSGKTLTSPTISAPTITNPTITVDTISEFTAANGVTIDGLNIKDSRLNTSNSVPNNALINTGTFGSSWAWVDWVPTFVNLAGGTLTFAKYTQLGKTVHFRIYYILAGAGVSGSVTFTLPVTAASGMEATHPIGLASLVDNSTAAYQGFIFAASTTTGNIRAMNAAGTYTVYTQLTSTIPFTWGNTDFILLSGTYEAA